MSKARFRLGFVAERRLKAIKPVIFHHPPSQGFNLYFVVTAAKSVGPRHSKHWSYNQVVLQGSLSDSISMTGNDEIIIHEEAFNCARIKRFKHTKMEGETLHEKTSRKIWHCSRSCQSHLRPSHEFILNTSPFARLIYSISAARIELCCGALSFPPVYWFLLCAHFAFVSTEHTHKTNPLFNARRRPFLTTIKTRIYNITQ